MDDRARDLFRSAVFSVGWYPPEGTLDELVSFCRHVVKRRVRGGQDREHAYFGIREAVKAAETGNAPYVRAGLYEAMKVFDLYGR